jgi:hypothetical protein
MKMIILLLITIILIALATVFTFATLRTWQVQNNPFQKTFLSGSVPSKLPEGLYKGEVPGRTFSWKGKKFNTGGKGINVFPDGDKYPFKYYEAIGLQDNKKVIRIDYNLSENPLWLRFIVDEIVETSPGKYLGKLHVQLFPGLVASLGYFKLEK